MSRTYKDRHWKLRFPDHAIDEYDEVPYTSVVNRKWVGCELVECAPYEVERSYRVKKPGVFTKKKRKDYNNEYQWVGETPGWWVRMLVNRPLRRKGRMWEREASKCKLDASYHEGGELRNYKGYEFITVAYYDATLETLLELEKLDVETPRVARGETSVPYYW